MNSRRNLTPLIIGVLLVGLGVALLLVNMYGLRFRWSASAWFIFPALFLWIGLVKLVRHFSLSAQQLREYPRRGSLLSGLFWTTVGVLSLLDLLHVLNGWDFFGRYWPGLLVLFGLGKIFDYYRLHGVGQFRTAELIGVILIIFLGALCSHIAESHFPLVRLELPMGDENPFETGQKFRWTETTTVDPAGARELNISNLYGDVRVEGSSVDSITVELQKVITGHSESEARDIAERIRIEHSLDGSVLHLGTNRKDLAEERYRFNTHFSVTVPENLQVRIGNKFGDVRVASLKALCEIDNSNGDVTVEDLTGRLSATTEYRPLVVRRVEGNVDLQNRHGSIEANDVTGSLQASTDYDSISSQNIRGDVSIRNQFGSVRLEKVTGTADIDAPGSSLNLFEIGKAVTAQNSHKTVTARELSEGLDLVTKYSRANISDVLGPVTVNSSHTDVRVSQFGSSLTVQDEYGGIFISNDAQLKGSVSATNRTGDINLELPAGSSFKLVAQAPNGEVMSEFGMKHSRSRQIVEESYGSGSPEVRLETTYATIRIRKKGESHL